MKVILGQRDNRTIEIKLQGIEDSLGYIFN